MSNDVLQELLERVARLEEEVQQLKTQRGQEPDSEKPWWEQIAGSHKGSKAFEEIVRLGAQIRRAERNQGCGQASGCRK